MRGRVGIHVKEEVYRALIAQKMKQGKPWNRFLWDVCQILESQANSSPQSPSGVSSSGVEFEGTEFQRTPLWVRGSKAEREFLEIVNKGREKQGLEPISNVEEGLDLDMDQQKEELDEKDL